MRCTKYIVASLILTTTLSVSAYGAHKFERCTVHGYWDINMNDRSDLVFNLLVAATPIDAEEHGFWLNSAVKCDTCADPDLFIKRAEEKAKVEFKRPDAYSEEASLFLVGREQVCDVLYNSCARVGGNASIPIFCNGIWWEE